MTEREATRVERERPRCYVCGRFTSRSSLCQRCYDREMYDEWARDQIQGIRDSGAYWVTP